MSADKLPKPLPDINTPEGATEVLKLAAKGREDMLPLVRKLFDPENPGSKDLIERYGNSYAHARDELIKSAAGTSLAFQEGLRRKIDAVRDELAGSKPTPLERILCERVALCWFDANETDRRYIDQTDISFKTAEFGCRPLGCTYCMIMRLEGFASGSCFGSEPPHRVPDHGCAAPGSIL
ncbi:MAG: hypothetical protein JO355_05900 [Planctomycetaceae bacterium]|nr:hypothetical protein [Planctomycetaceae bacterium]